MSTALVALGVGSGILSGISGFLGARKRNIQKIDQGIALQSEALKIQAQINQIQDFVKNNKIDPNQATERMAKLISATSGKMQKAIQVGLEDSIVQMKDAYGWSVEDLNAQLEDFNDIMNKESGKFRETWQESFDKVQDVMVRRRLAGSEAQRAMARKDLKQLKEGELELAERRGRTQEEFARQKTRLGQQLQSNLKTAQSQARQATLNALAGIEFQAGMEGERQRRETEMYNAEMNKWGLGQQLQGEQQQSLLRSQGESLFGGTESALGAGIGGATEGILTGVASGLFGSSDRTKKDPYAQFDNMDDINI